MTNKQQAVRHFKQRHQYQMNGGEWLRVPGVFDNQWYHLDEHQRRAYIHSHEKKDTADRHDRNIAKEYRYRR